jgi:hypothetical protein
VENEILLKRLKVILTSGPIQTGVLLGAVGESRPRRNKSGCISSSKGPRRGNTSGSKASPGLPLCCKAPTQPVKGMSR